MHERGQVRTEPPRQAVAEERGRQRTDGDLSLGTDVEQTRMERQGHGEPREDVGGGPDRRLAQRARGAEGPLEEPGVGIPWARAGGGDDTRAHDEGREDRQDGDQKGSQQGGQGEPQGFGFTGATPVLTVPSSRLLASASILAFTSGATLASMSWNGA